MAAVVALVATACKIPVPPAASADLAVSQSVDNATPAYAQQVQFTTVVKNLGADTATGVTATIVLPNGLSFVSSAADYAPDTGLWTIGTLAAGAQATLAISVRAGDVVIGDRTVTATTQSLTADPSSANNSASTTVSVVPANVSVAIVPDPGNPQFIDVSDPGSVTWTAAVVNENDPSAPIADLTTVWICDTASENPCPSATGLIQPNQPLTFADSDFGIDTYTILLLATTTDPNYTSSGAQTQTSFSTINSGGN